MKFLYTDSRTGKACGAKTMYSLFSIVVTIKFALMGMTIGDIEFGSFDAAEAALLLGGFAGAYGWRSHDKAKTGA